jgi:hypothetical protein
MKRECGECTECCKGSLTAVVLGKQLAPGHPCHYLGSRCTIYADRPETPCREFRCIWLSDDAKILPEWMQPHLSKVIVTDAKWGEKKERYWILNECDGRIDAAVLNWFIQYCLRTGKCMVYTVDKVPYYLGPEEFINEVSKIEATKRIVTEIVYDSEK